LLSHAEIRERSLQAETLNLSHDELREVARTLRRDAVMMTNAANSGHTGGPFSMADYTAALVFNHLRLRPHEPYWDGRDKFVISNGHVSALQYSLLSRRGFFSPGYLLTFRSTPSRLQGHPNHIKLPGVEIGTGSLGQGLSAAHGMALGKRLSGHIDQFVYCNVGDGEMQEGQIWEAIMHAGHRGTDNFVMSVDYNDIQIDGRVREVKRLDPLDKKLEACHWLVQNVDGHDMEAINAAWTWARLQEGAPKALIFHTTMMKGVGEYEDKFKWHGTACSDEQAEVCLKALGYEFENLDEIRAEYGAPVYDGVIQQIQASPWARVVHMDSAGAGGPADLTITADRHNELHPDAVAPDYFREMSPVE
jgi:transketolase